MAASIASCSSSVRLSHQASNSSVYSTSHVTTTQTLYNDHVVSRKDDYLLVASAALTPRVFAAAVSFLYELAFGEDSAPERLLHGHRRLFGLKLVEGVDERAGRRGQRQPLPPHRRHGFVVGAGVEHDPGRAAQAAVAARHEQMHRAGDCVAQLEQRQRALVGEDGFLGSDGHPLLAHLVVLGARKALQPVEPPPHRLEAAPARVVVQQLATDPMRARLSGSEIAMLLVGLRLQGSNIGTITVMLSQV
jgi:hypothetical protein